MKLCVSCGNWIQAKKIVEKFRIEDRHVKKIGNALFMQYEGSLDEAKEEFNQKGMTVHEIVI